MNASIFHFSIKALLLCTVLSFPLMSAAQNIPYEQASPGDTLLANGEFANAVEIYEKEVASGNADVNITLKYGVALYNDGEYQKAV